MFGYPHSLDLCRHLVGGVDVDRRRLRGTRTGGAVSVLAWFVHSSPLRRLLDSPSVAACSLYRPLNTLSEFKPQITEFIVLFTSKGSKKRRDSCFLKS